MAFTVSFRQKHFYLIACAVKNVQQGNGMEARDGGAVLSEGGPSHAEDPCEDFGQGTGIPEGKTSSAG